MKRSFSFLAALALAVTAIHSSSLRAAAQSAPTPPPSPPPINGPAPTATPALPAGTPATPPPGGTVTIPLTLGSQKPAQNGKATPSPPPDPDANRVGISGVWEVQIQHPNETTYTHFKLVQSGSVLTGQYLDSDGKRYPLAGSVDNKDVRVVVSLPNGTSLVFAGKQDGKTDMMGLLAIANDSVPFTAAYRPKYKWIDNLAPGGNGMPGVP